MRRHHVDDEHVVVGSECHELVRRGARVQSGHEVGGRVLGALAARGAQRQLQRGAPGVRRRGSGGGGGLGLVREAPHAYGARIAAGRKVPHGASIREAEPRGGHEGHGLERLEDRHLLEQRRSRRRGAPHVDDAVAAHRHQHGAVARQRQARSGAEVLRQRATRLLVQQVPQPHGAVVAGREEHHAVGVGVEHEPRHGPGVRRVLVRRRCCRRALGRDVPHAHRAVRRTRSNQRRRRADATPLVMLLLVLVVLLLRVGVGVELALRWRRERRQQRHVEDRAGVRLPGAALVPLATVAREVLAARAARACGGSGGVEVERRERAQVQRAGRRRRVHDVLPVARHVERRDGLLVPRVHNLAHLAPALDLHHADAVGVEREGHQASAPGPRARAGLGRQRHRHQPHRATLRHAFERALEPKGARTFTHDS